MDESSKNKAYLEGQRLKKAGMDDVVILAKLEKQGIPEELALQVIKICLSSKKSRLPKQINLF